jgi:hypothetical protein
MDFIFCGGPFNRRGRLATTIINGKIVMENRVLLNVDKVEVFRKANQCAQRIIT